MNPAVPRRRCLPQAGLLLAISWTLAGCGSSADQVAPGGGSQGAAAASPSGPGGTESAGAARPTSVEKTPEKAAPAPPEIRPAFTNAAAASGIDFTFFSDIVPGRYFLPEVMGGGAGWFDYDRDGLLDLFLQNGTYLREQASDIPPDAPTITSQLYRQRPDHTFELVTGPAAASFVGYGQGIAVGDFNSDGHPDLFLANYGCDRLLRNNGDGTFTDVASAAGVTDDLWGSSPVWFDVDDDGDLDLYVTNYMDVTFATHKVCDFTGKKGYCGPGSHNAVPDALFVNQGDGRFINGLDELGFKADDGKGLAIIVADFDDDLRAEVYVANDMAPNFLFTRSAVHGSGPTVWRDVAVAAGCAQSGSGLNEASMGISCADFDQDGRFDIYLTHYYRMKNTLYRNLGGLLFEDDSRRSRVAAISRESLGFGTVPFDYDRDGDPDIFVANGHVLGRENPPFEMRPQLLLNQRTHFDDVSDWAGEYFQDKWLGRGTAAADYDNDGDIDILVTHLERPVALLRNDTETGRHFLGLSLESVQRLAPVGGRVVVQAGGLKQTQPVTAGGSYLSSSDARMLFGLGRHAGPVQIEIHWPSGNVERHDLAADRYWTIREGRLPE